MAVPVLATQSLRAQTRTRGDEVAAAADIISPDAIARHVGVMADDSMLGRDTPSPGLEQTAQYVAAQFQALGLQPAGDGDGWTQRYAPLGYASVDEGNSFLFFLGMLKKGKASVFDEFGYQINNPRIIRFPTAAVFATDTVVDSRAPGVQGSDQGSWAAGNAPVVVAGPHTAASLREANLRDKVVVYIPSTDADTALQRQLVDLLRAANHVIIVADEDSAAFAARARACSARPPVVLDWYLPEATRRRHWAVYAWARAIESGLATAGVQLAEVRTTKSRVVQEIAAEARLHTTVAKPTTGPSAPNVVGLLEGRIKQKVIVLTAHMDHLGVPAGHTGRVANGDDDNASGVAGLLELAKALTALARSGVVPRYSIVFAATSGGAKAFWGSSVFVDRWQESGRGQIVLNLNLDRLGQAARDSVRINGLQEVELVVRSEWVVAQHPELRLTVVDGGSVIAPESDHFAFVRKAVPSLYVHGREHGAASDDEADAINAEQEARILRLVFYLLMEEPANTPPAWRPQWTGVGRQRRAVLFGQSTAP